MSKKITDYTGKEVTVDCIGCALSLGKIQLPNGFILETEYFTVGQDYEIPIPGFFIIGTKRHIAGIGELDDNEAGELLEIIRTLRKALRELDIKEVYLIQEEDSEDHFHVWIFPRYGWMKDLFGKGVQYVRSIMSYAKENMSDKKSLEEVSAFERKIKERL